MGRRGKKGSRVRKPRRPDQPPPLLCWIFVHEFAQQLPDAARFIEKSSDRCRSRFEPVQEYYFPPLLLSVSWKKKKEKLETRVEVSLRELVSSIYISDFCFGISLRHRFRSGGRESAGWCGGRKVRMRRNASSRDRRKGRKIRWIVIFATLRLTSPFAWQVLLFAFWPAKTNPPRSPLIRAQAYLCPRLDDTPPCCLNLSRHSNPLRSLHLHLKIYGVLRSASPEANMQCYVRILVCSKDLLQPSVHLRFII